MRRVHRDVVSDQSTNTLIDVTANGLSASPEKAMVDNQQIGSLLDGALDGTRRGIDRHGAASDRSNVLDLNSVHRAAVVRHFARAQHPVEVRRNLAERGVRGGVHRVRAAEHEDRSDRRPALRGPSRRRASPPPGCVTEKLD